MLFESRGHQIYEDESQHVNMPPIMAMKCQWSGAFSRPLSGAKAKSSPDRWKCRGVHSRDLLHQHETTRRPQQRLRCLCSHPAGHIPSSLGDLPAVEQTSFLVEVCTRNARQRSDLGLLAECIRNFELSATVSVRQTLFLLLLGCSLMEITRLDSALKLHSCADTAEAIRVAGP